jgi:WhiB family redox-sensing transcriptional regulator
MTINLAKKGQLKTMLTDQAFPDFGIDAACFGQDTELFYSDDTKDISAAKAICGACPVIKECATWAVQHEEFGVFGGLSAKERNLMRGGQPAVDTQLVAKIRAELNFIFDASAKEVALRFGVQTRTVVRWRNILRPIGMVG